MPSRAGSMIGPGNFGAAGCPLPRVLRSRTRLRGEFFMPQRLEPKLNILPAAQQEIWTSLAPASHLGYILYGGTAIALQLGHRESLDFDFFRSEPLNKDQVRGAFGFVHGAAILQDMPN